MDQVIDTKAYVDSEISHVKDLINEVKELVMVKAQLNRELIDANRELSEATFTHMQTAVDKAEVAQDLRNKGQNEWRAQYKDQTQLFATAESVGKVNEDIKILQIANATQMGKASQNSVLLTLVISISGLAIGLIDLVSRIMSK